MATEYTDLEVLKVTGSGALGINLAPTNPSKTKWRIIGVKLRCSSNPVTSEDFVVQINDSESSVYNTVLLTQNMASTQNVVQHWEGFGLPIAPGQSVDLTWDNTDAVTWGLIVHFVEDEG